MTRGAINGAGAKVSAALVDYQSAHNLFRTLGESRSQSIALVTIGMLYQEADDNENALKYYSRALDVYTGDPPLSLSIIMNRGNALKELKRYKLAQREFNRAISEARKLKLPALEAKSFRNLARLAVELGDYEAADRAIGRGLIAARAADGLRVSLPQFNAIAAESAARRGQLSRARALIESVFAQTDLTTTDLSYREAHYTAYSVYAKLGNRPHALAHLQAMKRLDDQVWKLTASANTALMAARFDSANQEARIAKLKADDLSRRVAMERAQSRFERILFVGVVATILTILGMLGIGLYQSRRARIRLSASNTALESALAAKTQFLATTSHEIRTPLNGILGMTQVMLADPRLDAKLRERVGIVNSAGLTMRGLVDDILDVAKMETGNLVVEAAPFDLKATLEDVTRMWSEQARAKGLAFHLEVDACPRGVVGDSARLRQVIYNLLGNAVKFTATGSIAVRVACVGDRLRIAVADTGIGIPADQHDAIFESFKQADGSTTRQFGGTGLGLAIVRNIAAALGGGVTVASTPGAGATFTLDLPLVAADLPDAAAAPAPSCGGLLVVDRNPIGRAMLKAVLEPRFGPLLFAADCAAAAALAGQGGVERILVDEAAARADGADPLAAVAELAAAVAIPVAVLWPAPDPAQRAALLDAGVDQVLAKPIAGPALAAALCDGVDETALVTRAA